MLERRRPARPFQRGIFQKLIDRIDGALSHWTIQGTCRNTFRYQAEERQVLQIRRSQCSAMRKEIPLHRTRPWITFYIHSPWESNVGITYPCTDQRGACRRHDIFHFVRLWLYITSAVRSLLPHTAAHLPKRSDMRCAACPRCLPRITYRKQHWQALPMQPIVLA